MKKIWVLLVTVILMFGLLGGSALTAYAANDTNSQSEETVTRLEWLKSLTTAFQMEVEEQNYPDNYYTDVDASSEDYYDIMLATEFGLVDVEAGGKLRPDDPATREFAAHTLNLCMGYFPDEEAEYTFSEADSVTYPDDIQIAINKGWIKLSGNDFLPSQGITVAEKDKMIAAAEAVVASTVIDENYEGSYELVEGVVIVPEGTEVMLTDENELTIYECPVELKAGDIFVVFSDGFPVARRAITIAKDGDATVVAVESVELEEAFTDLDVQGIMRTDLTQVQAIDDSVQLAYIVGGTEEQAYDDGVTFYSLDEVDEQKVNAVIVTKEFETTDAMRSIYGLKTDENVKVKCKISNVQTEYDANVSLLDNDSYAYFNVSATLTFSFNIKTDDMTLLKLEQDFVRVPIGLVGYFKPQLEGEIGGSFSLSMKSNLSVGVQWTSDDGVRMNFDFQKEAFTIQAKAEGSVGVKAAIGVDVGFLKAELYVKAGGKAYVKIVTYTDGQYPEECWHMSAHLYASAGGVVKFNVLWFKNEVSLEKTLMNEKNSPVKVAVHFDEGEPVSECYREADWEDGELGDGSSGTSGTRQFNYFTPINSQYTYSGANTGKSSTGETYTIFEYELDDSNQATITAYHGNVAALNIPEIIDGYTVVGIDNGVFRNNTRLMMVTIPDTVTEIDQYAFRGCSNLMDVTLSKALVKMWYGVFYDCDALTSIEIPKSLDVTANELDGNYGAFVGCDNLKTITFEEGTTQIARGLLSQCSGLEEIIIPDTVTVIEQGAFENCKNMKKISLSSSLTEIENSAFYGCESLEEIIMPDSVVKIGSNAFSRCTKLANVKLSKSLTKMEYGVFAECDSINSIEIPKSLDETINELDGHYGSFVNCDNLKTVTFEEGTTQVAKGLFSQCVGLEEIVIPDSVTIIEQCAFEDCKNLKKVILSSGLTEIANSAFKHCTLLVDIELPNAVVKIGAGAFSGCASLTKMCIPDSVIEIGQSTFANCIKLSDVTLSKNMLKLGDSAFENCDLITSIEIPKKLDENSNGYGAFINCSNLKTVTFEEGTTKIANGLFSYCTGLEEIVIPDTVTIVETSAFKECTNLKKIVLSSKLTHIDNFAFQNCKLLSEIVLPSGLLEIGASAFKGCSVLNEIIIPDTVDDMGTYIFSECTSLKSVQLPNTMVDIKEGMFQKCVALTNIELPDNVTYISAYAFQNSGLESISLPSNLQTINTYAFNNCDALRTITIPNSVLEMGTYCFADCEVLSEVQLGNGLTSINKYTFNMCPALEKITLPYRVSTVSANAFTNCINLTELTIPRATESILTNAFSYPTKMTVYGVSGTYAEEWANSVGATFVNQEVPATEVTFNETALTLYKGETANLIMTVTPKDFTDEVIWKSNNTSVATITDTGVVTAKGTGTATIRVTVGDVSASCKVTVVQPVTSISLSQTTLYLEAERVSTLRANVYPTTANDKTVTWSSSDETVATVDQSGNVKALKKGTAIITVTANDGSGTSKSCTVTVTSNLYRCNAVSEMESPHKYENNCNDLWVYTLEGAERLSITFDKRTYVEDEFDYIYLYDAEGKEIGTYTGGELAGQTLILNGDTIKVKLDTDNAGNEWGFKVTNIEEYCEHTYANIWSGDETHHWYASTCGHAYAVKDKAEHTLTDWIIDKEATTEAAGSKHMECLVCKRTVKTETIPQLRDYVKELEDRLTVAMNQSVEAAANLTSENYGNATEEEKQQAVANVLNQISSLCTAQDIDELGILPVDTALTLVGNVTRVEQRIVELLNTSVTVVAKDAQQTLALPTVQNALLSVDAGENATIKVAQVQTPIVEGVDLSNAVAMTMELFNASDEKMNLKAPVIVTLPIPAGVDANEKISIYHFHEGSTEYMEIIPTKVDITNNTITFVTGSFSTFTVANVPTGAEVSGTITSFGDASAQIKVQLTDGSGNIVKVTTVTGNSASYSLTEVMTGTYTMSISKAAHMTRTYAVTVSDSNVSYDAKIQLKGDVTGDGVVNARDKKMIYNHISGTSALNDYTFLVGDVTGDGVINARDKKMIYNHIAGTSSLWE